MTRTMVGWRLRTKLATPANELNPYRASEIALLIGDLAPWCLLPEVLRMAAADEGVPAILRTAWLTPPRLPATAGGCHVVFATANPRETPLLRESFVLPFRWIQSPHHGLNLPMNVTKLADAVLRDLQILPGEWSLHWADPLRLAEGGLLCLDASSGWASLAAGLIVAMRGGAPRPDVWATGSWKWPDGISSVRGLEVKLRFAVEQGAAAFFVPASQVTEARNLVQHQALQIGPLIGGQRDPLRALREYLWTLELPPEMTNEPDGLARCSDYFLRIPAEKPAEMHEFYRKTLLPALARRLREQVRNEWSDWSPTHLITIVSGSPDLVRLVARALRISRCLLLHTADFEHYCAAMELRADLMADAVDCQLGALPGQDGFSESMGPPIREFLVNVPAQQVVFDMTPGTKRMTLALSQFVRSTNWNVYVSHSISADRRPIPGTERLLRWNGRD